MAFTNSTPNYGLPQWISADKPKFLTDINNAYGTIDTELKNANDTANTADGNATSALSIAGQAATTAEGAATVAGQAAALAQSVNELVGTLNARMGTTSISTIGDGTVTGAIDVINKKEELLNITKVKLERDRERIIMWFYTDEDLENGLRFEVDGNNNYLTLMSVINGVSTTTNQINFTAI